MKNHISCLPDTATGEIKSAGNGVVFGNKRAVGALAGGMSVRWVDGQLAKGMPHLKLGLRRVRFDMEEVRDWLKTKYGQQRRSPGRTAAAPTAD